MMTGEKGKRVEGCEVEEGKDRGEERRAEKSNKDRSSQRVKRVNLQININIHLSLSSPQKAYLEGGRLWGTCHPPSSLLFEGNSY